MINVFIGYDSKEKVPIMYYHIVLYKIVQSNCIYYTTLTLNNLKDDFVRERNNISSTEFSFSRFMIPHLMNYQGWGFVYGL